jgi:hypothetical protein
MLEEAMRQLCTTSRTFLGAIVMILIIIGILLHAANYFLNSGKPSTKKKPLLWLAGTWILALSFLLIVIYIISPPIARMLLGPGNASDPCNTYYQPAGNYTPQLPYCGAYCANHSRFKDYPNCTCEMYLQG